MKRKLDSSELIQEITETLAHWSGTDLAEKASEILGHEVTYLDDDVYEAGKKAPHKYEIIDDPVEGGEEDDADVSEVNLHEKDLESEGAWRDNDLESEFLFSAPLPEEP